MRKTCSLVIAAALALSNGNAKAATIVVNQTIDLNNPVFAVSTNRVYNFTNPAVTVSEGDTLDLTINFLAGQKLSASSLSTIWAALFSNAPTEINHTGTLTFLGASGPLALTTVDVEPIAGVAHIGNFYGDIESTFTTGSGPVSFSGIRSQIKVNDYAQAGLVSRLYNAGGLLNLRGTNLSVVTGAVPEPATWAMMLLGFGFVGGALRSGKRRQNLTVSFA
jgi:PEP-CTERM motif